MNDTFVEGRGVDTVIFEIAKRLSKKHDVYVFCSKNHADLEEKANDLGITVIKGNFDKLFTSGIGDLSFPLKLRAVREFFKKRKNFDVINLHHATMYPAFLGMDNVVVTYHGSPPAYGKTKYARSLVNSFSRLFLRHAKAIISISNYLRNELIRYNVKKEIFVIPNGVDNAFFVEKTEDRNFMLFVGRLEKHKRVDMLIKLAKDINFKIIIAGTGPELEKLKSYAKEISADVKFLGKISREKLIDLYSSCSFFVSASEWEGFGLIFLEANACGKPVIGFNRCAISERIVHGINGFLVNNYEELKKYAEILKENRNYFNREKIVEIAKRYSWDNVAKKYEEVFNKILEKV